MPIQMWTQDRVPELALAGSQSLARGISGAGHSLGQAIERYGEEKKKREEELKRVLLLDKHAIGMRKAMSEDAAARRKLPSVLDMTAMEAGQPSSLMIGAERAIGFEQGMSKLAEADEERANAARLGAGWQRAGEMGQPPEAVPGPFSNEEFDRRTQPLTAQSFMQAISQQGARPGAQEVNFAEALMRNAPQPARGLPLGTEQRTSRGTIIGTGEHFEPNFIADLKPEAEPAPAYDWLIAPDDETFQRGLATLTDPKLRDKVMDARHKFQLTKRAPSFQEMMAEILSGRAAGGGAGKPAAGTGTGTQASPHQPADAAGFKKVKSGEYYIDPGDKQLYRKK